MILGGLLFVLGLCVGSFINSFLWRYSNKKTFKGRSICPKCGKKIAWYDNLPVISWFILRGKCRSCKKPISIQYPMVELMTGIIFGIVGVFSNPSSVISSVIDRSLSQKGVSPLAILGQNGLILNFTLLFLILIVVAVLITISVHDHKTKEIPNGFNMFFIIAAFLYLLVSNYSGSGLRFNAQNITYGLMTAAIAFAFFYSFVYFSKETWMGGGDAKFAFGMGLLLGPANTFLAILLGSVIGSIYGLSAIFLSNLKKNHLNSKKTKIVNLSSEIPFGPFLAIGTYVSLLFGTKIIELYVKIILGT